MTSIIEPHVELYNKTISSLKEANVPNINLNIVEYSARYFYTSLPRIAIYNELKTLFVDKTTVNVILMLVMCLKDRNKTCFPGYELYNSIMRGVIDEKGLQITPFKPDQ
jgi:hypothetical protein